MVSELTCSLCGVPRSEATGMVVRDDGASAICDRCLREAQTIRKLQRIDGPTPAPAAVGDPAPEVCAFCDKPRRQVQYMVGDGTTYICDECLDQSQELRPGTAPPAAPAPPTSAFQFQLYTESARQAIVKGQEAARASRHLEIATGHVLLGIVAEPAGYGARVLSDLGVDAAKLRSGAAARPALAGTPPLGRVPFGATCERLLIATPRTATGLGHAYVGTEHLLLTFVTVAGSDAAQLLAEQGIRRAQVETAVAQLP